MGDGPRGIEIFEDHFQASTSGEDSVQTLASSKYVGSNDSLRSISRSWTRRKLKGAASTLKLFSPSKLTWMSGIDGQEKVVLTAAEVESLRSEIPALEEREAHFKTHGSSFNDADAAEPSHRLPTCSAPFGFSGVKLAYSLAIT